MLVTNRMQADFQIWYSNEGFTKTKLNTLIQHKPKPTTAPYIHLLTRNQATTIFRIRSGMTTAANNYSTQATVCDKCKEGLASDTHFFQTCTSQENLRQKHNINGLWQVFTNDNDINVITNYANFTIEAKLLPELFTFMEYASNQDPRIPKHMQNQPYQIK